MSRAQELFIEAEGRASDRDASRRQAVLASVLAHLTVFAVLVVGPVTYWASDGELPSLDALRIRFYDPGEGSGGGGGGGGSRGERPTAYIPVRVEPPEAERPERPEPESRRAPIAPRKPRPLSFDELDVPDLPEETALLFGGVFSPDAVEFPGLSLTDGRDYGGLDRAPSSGTGGGIGGGEGTGVGTGEGWGVGPGRGGGFGGGDYSPGGWDIEPVLVYRPDAPDYPRQARERMVRGEVILQVLVKRDGSTEVVRVIKSLPYCVEAAKQHAALWRWKPALKNGKPVESLGIITVTFDIFSTSDAKG